MEEAQPPEQEQPESQRPKRWVAISKKHVGKASIYLNIFSIVLFLILNYTIDTDELDHSSAKYLFLNGLESRIIEVSFYASLVSLLERYLHDNGHEYSQTTYEVWKFMFGIMPYISAAFETSMR